MPHRLRLPAAVVAALVVAEAAVLLLRPKERYPVEQAEPRAYFSAAELERAVRLPLRPAVAVRRPQRWSSWRCSWPPCGSRRATGRRPVLTGAATAVGDHAGRARSPRCRCAPRRASAPRTSGLITQSWGGWAVDVAKGTAIGGVFAAAGGALLAFGHAPLRPRLVGAGRGGGRRLRASSSPTSGRSCSTRCSTSSRRCPAGDTRADVLDLAERAGVDVGEVYEVDASRRTTAANAYVTGIGRTKRVVLYDTLLKDFTPAETRLVVAHELGHVRYRDVPHGLLWLALVAPFGTLAVARASERLTPRRPTAGARRRARAGAAHARRHDDLQPALARDRAPRRRVRARH